MNDIKSRDGKNSKLVAEFMSLKRLIASLSKKQKEVGVKLDARMVSGNSKVLFYKNEYVQKSPNPTVSINVAKFKNATSKDEFMQCIKVEVAKARQVLSVGQVEQIIDTKSGSKFVTGNIE
jgi:hypothetical protein